MANMLLILALILPLVARGAADGDPGLAGVMEFDLVFPRNETYAPTQYFPLVLAVRNSTAAWPQSMILSLTIWPRDSKSPPPDSRFNFPPRSHTSGSPPSAPYFFFIAGTNFTNGTEGEFTVIWSVWLRRTCREVDPLKDPGEHGFHSGEFNVKFSTARGAQLPDIEAAVNACSQSTLALTPRGFREDGCVVLDGNSTTPGAATKCGLKPVAKELAASVSTTMLGLMGCPEGPWQSIKKPCEPEEKSGGFRSRSARGLGMVWMLLAVITCAVL